MAITDEQKFLPPQHDWVTGDLIRDPAWLKWFHNVGNMHKSIKFVNVEGDLDDIADGTNYARVNTTVVDASGIVILSQCSGDLDDVTDGTTYGKILLTDISAGHILLSETVGDLDDIADGTNYARVATTSISAGKIILTSATGVTGSLPTTNTDAKCTNPLADQTSANPQASSWLTDASNIVFSGDSLTRLTDRLLTNLTGDLDDISDGTVYARVGATYISSGRILLAEATGDLDDIANGSNYGKVAITDISAGHILLATCTGDLDDIANGTNYGKVALTSISAGKIILTSATGVTGSLPTANTDAKCTDPLADQTSANTAAAIAGQGDLATKSSVNLNSAEVTNKVLDYLSNGTYGKVLTADLSSGHVLLSACSGNLDNIANGATYGKVALTDISAGHIVLSTCTGDLDDIADGTNYGKVALTAISAGKIKLDADGVTGTLSVSLMNADAVDRMFATSTLRANVSAGLLEIIGKQVENLIVNPGFEDDDGSNAYAWVTAAYITLQTTGGKDSNQFLRLTRSGTNITCGQITLGTSTARYIEVNEGEVYEYGGSLKSSNGTTVAVMGIWLYDKDFSYYGNSTCTVTATTWTSNGGRYTIPATVKFIRAHMGCTTADGYADFDNLYLRKTDKLAYSWTNSGDRTKIEWGNILGALMPDDLADVTADNSQDLDWLDGSTGTLAITSTGNIAIAAASGMLISSGGSMIVQSGGGMSIQSGGGLTINSGGDITIQDGGDLVVEQSGDIILEGGESAKAPSILNLRDGTYPAEINFSKSDDTLCFRMYKAAILAGIHSMYLGPDSNFAAGINIGYEPDSGYFVDILKLSGETVQIELDDGATGLIVFNSDYSDGYTTIGTSAHYVAIGGGMHVGGTSDPGNDNLQVDGAIMTSGVIQLGHAYDTTVERVSAGIVSIEGKNIVTVSDTQTLTNKTLTSPSINTGITMPEDGWIGIGAALERIVFDGSGGTVKVTAAFLSLGALDGTNEGGEIFFEGAGSYDDWMQDLYQGNMRIWTNSANTNYVSIFNNGDGIAHISIEGGCALGGIAAASAPNSSLYNNSADGKVYWKDSGGTSHALY